MMNNRLEIAREFANEIKSEHIKRVILFGSVARGEDGDESDIDILIIVPSKEEVEDYIADVAYSYIAKYHEVISAHLMTLEHYNRTKNYSFLTVVQEEGVILV